MWYFYLLRTLLPFLSATTLLQHCQFKADFRIYAWCCNEPKEKAVVGWNQERDEQKRVSGDAVLDASLLTATPVLCGWISGLDHSVVLVYHCHCLNAVAHTQRVHNLMACGYIIYITVILQFDNMNNNTAIIHKQQSESMFKEIKLPNAACKISGKNIFIRVS